VDDATEEIFQQPKEVAFDAHGFLGTPCDISILTAYVDHVAVIV